MTRGEVDPHIVVGIIRGEHYADFGAWAVEFADKHPGSRFVIDDSDAPSIEAVEDWTYDKSLFHMIVDPDNTELSRPIAVTTVMDLARSETKIRRDKAKADTLAVKLFDSLFDLSGGAPYTRYFKKTAEGQNLGLITDDIPELIALLSSRSGSYKELGIEEIELLEGYWDSVRVPRPIAE
ncbi:MAG TPA: hypothetical protein VIH90_06510 [Candidatus Saccharimonadales bacterium]